MSVVSMAFWRKLTAVPLAAAALAGLALAGCSQPAHTSRTEVTSATAPIAGSAALFAGLDHRRTHPVFYLSLGDSLSQGIQPGPTGQNGPTAQGYTDQLERMLLTRIPELRLVKLGCSGETTATMIDGGICHYPAGS